MENRCTSSAAISFLCGDWLSFLLKRKQTGLNARLSSSKAKPLLIAGFSGNALPSM
jgi:hypothetical protein